VAPIGDRDRSAPPETQTAIPIP
jgi:hypothetical protein